MSKIKVEHKNDKLYVYTPYNWNFVKMVRPIGDWNGSAWEVDGSHLADINRMLTSVYGYDPENQESSINVEVFVKSELWGEGRDGVYMFGRQIARAFGRDSGAKIGESVSFFSGDPESGGSAKYWGAIIPEGANFVVYDVPEGALKLENEYADYIDIKPIIPKKAEEPKPAPAPVRENEPAKDTTIGFRIDSELKKEITNLLKQEGSNLSTFLTRAIVQYINDKKSGQK
ncbi:hypothetical protein [Megasphaera massiliensis]|uniref:hypothetical protein n=1 Tax=Megasphaera massiliensis TaxID=1232428 RepID=UPI00040EEF5C|nr:hypothetical protein [Megasphaera massiliensis]DAF84527.1 MAG TPA: antitoxin [Caudoviricetes sp.]